MARLVRRLASVVVTLLLVTALPLAAARAACVCDHEHQHEGHGQTRAAAGHHAGHGDATPRAPHRCSAACTAATCPMHRGEAASADASPRNAAGTGGIRCDCAGTAQALLTQVSVAGVLPGLVSVPAPSSALAAHAIVAESPSSLAATPPAPPPRA